MPAFTLIYALSIFSLYAEFLKAASRGAFGNQRIFRYGGLFGDALTKGGGEKVFK